MVNFVAVIDADADRRRSYIKNLESVIAPVEGLEVHSLNYQDLSMIWAAGNWTPVSKETNSSGISIIFGDAIGKDGSRIDAKENQQRWSNIRQTLPSAYDGYHAALTYDHEGKLTCGLDILGLFPLYYYSNKTTILIASTPESFRYYSDFSMSLDHEGLVGILLINSSFKGRTLFKDVKRLEAGHLLQWEHGKVPQEIEQYIIPFSTKYFDYSMQEAVDVLYQTIDQSIKRHVLSGNKYALFLSGGLDSRMLAGYLKQNNTNFIAVTEGLETDGDMKCAVRVARELGLEHIKFSVSIDTLTDAQKTANLEHLACGFGSVTTFGYCNLLRTIAPKVVSGYAAGAILGGIHVNWAYSKSKGTFSFENFFSRLNARGINENVLAKMLKIEIFKKNIIEDIKKEIETVYNSYSQIEFQKSLAFDLHHAQRYFIGGLLWKLSFGAWPVVPINDSQVLEVIGGMPSPFLLDRRLQIEFVQECFPRLARLPLDRSMYFSVPVKPSFLQKTKLQLGFIFNDNTPIKNYNPFSTVSKLLRGERVYYRRTMSFDNPTWKTLRNEVDFNKNRLYSYFYREPLEKALPKADVNSHFSLEHSSGPKILVGFSLWLKDHNVQASTTSDHRPENNRNID